MGDRLKDLVLPGYAPIGVGVLLVSKVDTFSARFGCYSDIAWCGVILVAGLSIVTGVFVLIRGYSVLFRDTVRKTSSLSTSKGNFTFEIPPSPKAALDLVTELDDFAREALQDEYKSASLNPVKLSELIKRSSSAVKCLYESGPKKFQKRLVGYAVLGGLNKKVTNEVLAGNISSGHVIPIESVCKTLKRASCIYIYGIYAIEQKAKGILTAFLIKELCTLFDSDRRLPECVLARGATTQGKRLVQQYKFKKINPESEIWQIEKSDILKRCSDAKGRITKQIKTL